MANDTGYETTKAVLKSLPGFKSAGKDQFIAQCPAHEDKKASLSISVGIDKKILLHCHAGCPTKAITDILGIDPKNLFPPNGNGHHKEITPAKIVATYDYRNDDNILLYQSIRYEPKDFRQRRPDSNGGWIWKTEGIERIPYNLSEVLKADCIYIVEGEKDVDNLRKIGLVATCNVGGAGKWTEELNKYFDPHQVITIIPDNDKVGQDHAENVARNLHGKVSSVKILKLDGLPDKGDVSDWLMGRDSVEAAEELSRLSDAIPEWVPTEAPVPVTLGRNISGEIRDYVDSIEGTFTTGQMYSDLGIFSVEDKVSARQTLMRLKGKKIQSNGNHSGSWRIIRGEVLQMNFDNLKENDLDLWLPFDLNNYVTIMPGNIIVVAGDPDAGKTAFLLNIIKRNVDRWNCHYFNSEMGAEELYKRLKLFDSFPIKHNNFHAYERANDFQDVIQPGSNCINIIDYLEVTDEFYLIGKYINDIHKVLGEAVAIIAIQKKSRNCDMPLGGARSLEKPRLVISLEAGSSTTANKAKILKCKNRKTEHSMIGMTREYKLVKGSEFFYGSSVWI